MKKYIAFLRGVNISGKNKIAMSELKQNFEKAGFSDVSTYLNSGNVKFSADVDNSKAIIEARIKEDFGLEIPVYVIENGLLNDILFLSISCTITFNHKR